MGVELINQSYKIKCLETKIDLIKDLAIDLKNKVHFSTLTDENEQEKLEDKIQELIDFIRCSQ